MKAQLWFKCEREGCDPRPFAWSAQDVQDAEGVVHCEHCESPCVPAAPPNYEAGFSREAITQYETVRLSGACNMFDRACVARYAFDNGLHLLVVIASRKHDYPLLLANYCALMHHYGLHS